MHRAPPFLVGVTLAGIYMLGGIASAAPSNAPTALLPGADKNECFLIRFSKDRRVLDDKHLIVWANGETPYLVELDRPLQRLSSGGQSIAFVDGDGDGQVCRTVRDKIVVLDPIAKKSRRIVGVTSLDADQIRALEAKYETSLARKKRGQWNSKKESAEETVPQEAPNESAT